MTSRLTSSPSALLLVFSVAASLGLFALPAFAENADNSTISASTAPAQATERPLVVFVYDKSCKISCGVVRPVLDNLQTQYGDKVQFKWLDVSKDTLAESRKTAEALGVSRFLRDCEDWYPAVGVFSSKRKLVKQLLGARPKEAYGAAIEKAIAYKK